LINELGTGVAGQGRMTNETFQAGAQDLNGLASITDVLQQRDTELKTIIESLQRLMTTLGSDQQRQTYVDLLAHSDQVLKTLIDEDANVRQGIDRMNTFFSEIDQGFAGRTQDLQSIVHNLPGTLSALDSLSVNLGAKGHRALPTLQNILPGFVEGPLIFGSQLDPKGQTAYTGNVLTRIQPTQGCFVVDGRTNPTGEKVVDSGTPQSSVCTAPAAVLGCLSLVVTDCTGSVLAVICSEPTVAPIFPLCHGPAAGSAATGGGQLRSPSSAPTSAPPIDINDQAHHDLLRYLLQ
jgi:ABC-type transporter Mla subunit MlaD